MLSVEFAKVFFAVRFFGLKRQYFCFRSPITALPGCLNIIIYLWAPFNHSATQVWSLLDENIQLCICWNSRVHNMEFMSAFTFMCVLHSLWNLIELSSNKLNVNFFWNWDSKMHLYQISTLYHEDFLILDYDFRLLRLRLRLRLLILDYEPNTRFFHQISQLPHQLALFISILCLQ